MTHQHYWILDRNSFGKCKCGATKQFPVERRLRINPKMVTPPKYDPDAWCYERLPRILEQNGV